MQLTEYPLFVAFLAALAAALANDDGLNSVLAEYCQILKDMMQSQALVVTFTDANSGTYFWYLDTYNPLSNFHGNEKGKMSMQISLFL